MTTSNSTGSPLRAVTVFAPHPFHPRTHPSLFLAGSIAGGHASNWQTTLTDTLSALPIAILNPRRSDWDSTWVESSTFPPFKEQVDWELDMQEAADVIAMYFDPDTKAPITLLELGLFARTGKMVVACPEGFWKRGNVEIVCSRFGIECVGSLEELERVIVRRLDELGTKEEGRIN